MQVEVPCQALPLSCRAGQSVRAALIHVIPNTNNDDSRHHHVEISVAALLALLSNPRLHKRVHPGLFQKKCGMPVRNTL
jgi:hypothetical protein